MPFAIQCPSCGRKLSVPDSVVGKRVKCPYCGVTFEAARPAEELIQAEPEEVFGIQPDEPPRVPLARDEIERHSSRSESRRSRDDAEDDDDRPRRRPRYDDEEEERPRRRRRRGYEDEEDEYGVRHKEAHRSVLVLTLGLVSLFVWCCPLAGWIVGGIALNMANSDLDQMARNRMDDSGRGMTMAGKICAIVAVVLATIWAFVGMILEAVNPMRF